MFAKARIFFANTNTYKYGRARGQAVRFSCDEAAAFRGCLPPSTNLCGW